MYRGELYIYIVQSENQAKKKTQQTYSITVMCPDYKYTIDISVALERDGRPHLKRINAGHAGVCVCFRDYRYESREITSSSSSSRIINF